MRQGNESMFTVADVIHGGAAVGEAADDQPVVTAHARGRTYKRHFL